MILDVCFLPQAIVRHDKERISQRKEAKRRKRESMRLMNSNGASIAGDEETNAGTSNRRKRTKRFVFNTYS